MLFRGLFPSRSDSSFAASMQQPAASMRKLVVVAACTLLAPRCMFDWVDDPIDTAGEGGAGGEMPTTDASTSTGGTCDPATCQCVTGDGECDHACDGDHCVVH